MKINMSAADRIIRLIISVIILTLYFTNVITGTLCLVLLIVAAIFALTGIAGYCPLYALFGISTICKNKK